jgi:hypothetical protein
MDNKEKVIDRIRKLLALSTSPNENEAASAAQKAQSLLAEYNLELGDVVEKKKEQFKVGTPVAVPSSFKYPWVWRLGQAVAKLYFCDHYVVRYQKEDRHTFVGADHNIMVAQMMFVYLYQTVDRLAKQGAKSVPEHERSPYRTSFRNTCTIRLCTRIRDMIEEAKRGEAKSSTGTNLPALANLYTSNAIALAGYMQQAVPNLKSKKLSTAIIHGQGAMDGDTAGRRIGLQTQVGANKRTAITNQ